MYLVTAIYRTASSGYQNRVNRLFETIEEASEYIRTEWYEGLCELNYYPSEWNEENLGGPMPTPEDFSVEAIKKKGSVLFAPYDKYHCIVQNELHIEMISKGR